MSLTIRARWWKAAVIAVALLCAAAIVVARPASEIRSGLLFGLLVLVTSFLRISTPETTLRFEAVVAFAALLVSHSPVVAFVAVFSGALVYCLYESAVERRWRAEALYDASQLALSYGIVGVLYAAAVARDADPAAKMAGFTLLLLGYAAVHLFFEWMRVQLEVEEAQFDVRRVLVAEGRMLLLVTPIAVVESMLASSWGVPGFFLGFVPVIALAFALRSEAESSQQNVELVRRNRELALLTESSTQILSAESDQETLRRVTSLLSKLAKMKACAIVTWEPHPDVPGTVYRFGECIPNDQDILRWVDSTGFSQSAPSRAFIFQSDMRKFPLSSGSAIQVLIGIQTPEVIYGILLFETEDLSILKAGALNLLTMLVNQTALSLQDQLLRREMRAKTVQLEENADTMRTILDVSNSLIGDFEVDAVLTRIALAVRSALGFEQVVVAVFDPELAEFVRRAQAGMDDVWADAKRKNVPLAEIGELLKPEFRISNSYFISHTALRKNEHDFFIRTDEAEERLLKQDEWHENDTLIVPLIDAGEILGYLWVCAPHDRRVPTIEKLRTLEVFASHVLTALQKSEQTEQIKRLTIIDPLTPAFNHRHFQESLVKELHRHERHGREFALAMLDIDNFKKINDTHGHPVGDEILKGLVAELLANARDTDLVARYGGEEFVMIFGETSLEQAHEAVSRLRELVAARSFRIPQLAEPLFITVSIGLATYPHDAKTPADLIARADAALYVAKRSGKNRVSLARTLISSDDSIPM